MFRFIFWNVCAFALSPFHFVYCSSVPSLQWHAHSEHSEGVKRKANTVCVCVSVYPRFSPWNLIRDTKYLSQPKKYIHISIKWYKTWCVLPSWCYVFFSIHINFFSFFFVLLLTHFRNDIWKIWIFLTFFSLSLSTWLKTSSFYLGEEEQKKRKEIEHFLFYLHICLRDERIVYFYLNQQEMSTPNRKYDHSEHIKSKWRVEKKRKKNVHIKLFDEIRIQNELDWCQIFLEWRKNTFLFLTLVIGAT